MGGASDFFLGAGIDLTGKLLEEGSKDQDMARQLFLEQERERRLEQARIREEDRALETTKAEELRQQAMRRDDADYEIGLIGPRAEATAKAAVDARALYGDKMDEAAAKAEAALLRVRRREAEEANLSAASTEQLAATAAITSTTTKAQYDAQNLSDMESDQARVKAGLPPQHTGYGVATSQTEGVASKNTDNLMDTLFGVPLVSNADAASRIGDKQLYNKMIKPGAGGASTSWDAAYAALNDPSNPQAMDFFKRKIGEEVKGVEYNQFSGGFRGKEIGPDNVEEFVSTVKNHVDLGVEEAKLQYSRLDQTDMQRIIRNDYAERLKAGEKHGDIIQSYVADTKDQIGSAMQIEDASKVTYDGVSGAVFRPWKWRIKNRYEEIVAGLRQ